MRVLLADAVHRIVHYYILSWPDHGDDGSLPDTDRAVDEGDSQASQASIPDAYQVGYWTVLRDDDNSSRPVVFLSEHPWQ